MKYFFVKSKINEDAMGGVTAPAATLNNVPGVGNAIPPTSTSIGSGDRWDGNSYTKKKKKKIKKVEEENINPYDKIGTMMAKKMKVPMTHKKKNSRKNTVSTKRFKVSESLLGFIKSK